MDCGYFDTTRNGNHSSLLQPTMVRGRCPLLSQIFTTGNECWSVGNYKEFPTMSQKFMNFGPQTPIERTGVFTHPL